jgi:RNA polymerase sigma factor (TIGR02999 family)
LNRPIPEPSPSEASQLLAAYRAGDRGALDRLFPLVYGELKALAARRMRRERSDHTLQTTALVHEAYLRLFGGIPIPVESRGHLLALASRAMRRVLVDAARRGRASKRPAAGDRVELEAGALAAPVQALDAATVAAVDRALEHLAALDPRQARIVELKFFGGLTLDEVAESLGVSEATVTREWRAARAWLKSRLAAEGAP